MTADADGVFHPFWADSRTGTFQAMTARVTVSAGGGNAGTLGPQSTLPPEGGTRTAADVTNKIEFINDPSRYDAATRELQLRIRLKNVSDAPIHGPLTLTIKKFGSGQGSDLRDRMPEVLNASNKAQDDGATFVYEDALGSERILRPGGISGPVLLRFRVKDPLRIPDTHLIVSGFVMR
jgi:hypothetical protein